LKEEDCETNFRIKANTIIRSYLAGCRDGVVIEEKEGRTYFYNTKTERYDLVVVW
jgi:hypothetical protein